MLIDNCHIIRTMGQRQCSCIHADVVSKKYLKYVSLISDGWILKQVLDIIQIKAHCKIYTEIIMTIYTVYTGNIRPFYILPFRFHHLGLNFNLDNFFSFLMGE